MAQRTTKKVVRTRRAGARRTGTMLGWRGPCPTGARSSMFRCVLVLCVGVLDELRERGARARAPAINADGGGQRKDCAPSRASAGTLRPPPREPSVHTEPNTTHLCGPISGSASWPPARRCRRAPTRAATCARARRTTAPPLPGCASRLLLPGRGSALRPTCRMCVCCVCVCVRLASWRRSFCKRAKLDGMCSTQQVSTGARAAWDAQRDVATDTL